MTERKLRAVRVLLKLVFLLLARESVNGRRGTYVEEKEHVSRSMEGWRTVSLYCQLLLSLLFVKLLVSFECDCERVNVKNLCAAVCWRSESLASLKPPAFH